MVALVWDELDERFFETGVSKGVLYTPVNGVYTTGVVWNGLTTVTQSPSGGEPNKTYADNIPYVTLMSAEEFNGTIEALMLPDEFLKFNGVQKTASGMQVSQQSRGMFGFSWQNKKGTAADPELGFVINLAYGCQASPSEKTHNTVNETPELTPFSISLTTTPVSVSGFKPCAHIAVDSTDPDVDPAGLQDLMDVLYGTGASGPRLPLPDEVDTLLTVAP